MTGALGVRGFSLWVSVVGVEGVFRERDWSGSGEGESKGLLFLGEIGWGVSCLRGVFMGL